MTVRDAVETLNHSARERQQAHERNMDWLPSSGSSAAVRTAARKVAGTAAHRRLTRAGRALFDACLDAFDQESPGVRQTGQGRW